MGRFAAFPFLIALVSAGPASAGDDRPVRRLQPELQRRINTAIDRGVAYLKSVQEPDGRWPYRRAKSAEMQAGTGGLTALCLYALAASRVPADDPSIRRGIAWTKANPGPFRRQASYATYSASLLVLALTRIDPKAHKRRIGQLAGIIAGGQLASDHWTYTLNAGGSSAGGRKTRRKGRRRRAPVTGPGDNSNSQFAVLALWAAESLAGIRIPDRTWERIQDAYARTRTRNGGWAYHPGARDGRPSMTAAGLVSYVYAAAALRGGQQHLPEARKLPFAKKGLRRFLGTPQNFGNLYYVYSLERVGTVLDVPLKDWYVGGAQALLRDQSANGGWGERGWHGDDANAYETALALLFLSRATRASITPGGDPDGSRKLATVTRRDQFPDPAKPGNLERAFEYYRLVKSTTRARIVSRFGAAGPAVVGFLIRKLRHPDAALRSTAAELLGRLLAKRFFFEPSWPEKDRKLMLEPIEAFWKKNHERLVWDKTRQRFVVH